MKAAELRRVWTEFWTARDHVLVPSSGLIPHHPTAPMFTNSGMMQFVPYFLGEEQAPFKRAQSIQKCARIGGKHNDIDEVGRTNRHLTFFEMLGNWSFGDYFKLDAITWSWELLTDVVGFDGDRIWITVHETDDEAEAIWHEQVGIPMERIQRMGKDNFWEMGDTGPCGPSTEMHWDLGPAAGPGGGPAVDADRYSEIWNDVFMTYFRQPDGTLLDLPSKNVDTGAGFERWLMLLDGVATVFDTDALRPIIRVAEDLTETTYQGLGVESDVALRVIGDHARTMTFLVSDGVVPSNEGRGYVLRGVIRRAVRRAYTLGAERDLVLPALVASVADHMGDAYPEIRQNLDAISATIEREEGRFRQTLKAGSSLLHEVLGTGSVPGEVAFKLHDTYGFPIEITQEVAHERGVEVDRAGFDAAMAEQRERARAARKAGTLDETVTARYREIVEVAGLSEFTGRQEYESKARVLAVLGGDDGTVEIFLDRTPFYAESGGQVGDTGRISTATGVAEVLDTTAALPGLHRHEARLLEGTITDGQEATAAIDAERRDAIRRNHTATHLLHWALREVLGSDVRQQGSLVGPDHLRFDFSHHQAMTPEQIVAVEDLVNAEVLRNDPVRHYETTKDEATALGAIAFFGDKYGDVVRVLEAGGRSIELCGGTHVGATGDIGPVKITSESSVGANLRRIVATTGTGTLARFREDEARLGAVASLLGVQPDDVVEGVERLRDELRSLRDELKQLRRQAAGAGAAVLAASAVDGIVVARSDGGDREGLKELAVAVRQQPGIRAVVLIGEPDAGGVALVAAVTKDSGLEAPALLQAAAAAVGGGGGGKGDVATAGGRDVSKIDDALDLARVAAGLPTGSG